jgi:precorrin-8X/cobalt-precorrin-8 methylmutase
VNYITKPAEIEAKSLEIIQDTLNLSAKHYDIENLNVIKRVIHTTADFDYADNLFFSAGAVRIAKESLKQGAVIVTDTQMARTGINKKAAAKLGCDVHCFIDAPEVVKAAQLKGTTRALAAVDRAVETLVGTGVPGDAEEKPIIFVVGNAPTALIRLHELILSGTFSPVLIIAMPVGFVNVVESKELILGLKTPHIVSKGRKGGSNVVAAVCNALLYELTER